MMYNQANTIKSYEDIRRVVRGDSLLTLRQKSILTFFLFIGILGGLMLVDCWGNILTTREQLQFQVLTSNGEMLLFQQQHQLNPLKKAKNIGRYQQKAVKKSGRKLLLKEKRKCKVAGIIFLASLSKNKP